MGVFFFWGSRGSGNELGLKVGLSKREDGGDLRVIVRKSCGVFGRFGFKKGQNRK